ncbi:hypothetical protein [Zavarzinella formosa]|uniref:hypothetical protein n=1 Tax=Zavarzinella formosa TaxID=360055 RepID=UPI0002D74E76|nr:hypothetical protein [Zavarzinella formosa]
MRYGQILILSGCLIVVGCGKDDKAAQTNPGVNGTGSPTPQDKGADPKNKTVSSPEPVKLGQVAFKLTSKELAEAFIKSETAYGSKYGGKVVEMTGLIQTVHLDKDFKSGTRIVIGLEGATNPKTSTTFQVYIHVGAADKDKFQGQKEFAKGQELTVRGIARKDALAVQQCEIVSAGPNPAIPFTVAGLSAALATGDGASKYQDKPVVIYAKVLKVVHKESQVMFTIKDPNAANGPEIVASIPAIHDTVVKELMQTKAGTVLYLIGNVDKRISGGIWHFRILNSPPTGVTVPPAN